MENQSDQKQSNQNQSDQKQSNQNQSNQIKKDQSGQSGQISAQIFKNKNRIFVSIWCWTTNLVPNQT